MELVADNHSRVVNFHLSESEYLKVRKGGDELLVGGKMYDIKSLVHKDNFIDIAAISDADEDNIITKIEKILGKGQSDKRSSEELMKLLSLFYIGTPLQRLCLFCSHGAMEYGSCTIGISCSYIPVTSPPPWVI